MLAHGCANNAATAAGQRWGWVLPDQGGLSSWAWSISHIQREHHRKVECHRTADGKRSCGQIFRHAGTPRIIGRHDAG